MVVREGSGWVLLHDGTRENLTATSVVIWEPGDWVEYGSNTGEGLKTESYWEKDLSEAEWKAIFARPSALTPSATGTPKRRTAGNQAGWAATAAKPVDAPEARGNSGRSA
jgi:hypothetical protein